VFVVSDVNLLPVEVDSLLRYADQLRELLDDLFNRARRNRVLYPLYEGQMLKLDDFSVMTYYDEFRDFINRPVDEREKFYQTNRAT
jgi:hypothetical protein